MQRLMGNIEIGLFCRSCIFCGFAQILSPGPGVYACGGVKLSLENQQHKSCATQAKQKNRGVNEIWADAVALAAGNASNGTAPKPLCAHLVRMGDLGNVPRQEKKFKASLRRHGGKARLWLFLVFAQIRAVLSFAPFLGVSNADAHSCAVRAPACSCVFLAPTLSLRCLFVVAFRRVGHVFSLLP